MTSILVFVCISAFGCAISHAVTILIVSRHKALDPYDKYPVVHHGTGAPRDMPRPPVDWIDG